VIVVHANHPQELDAAVAASLRRLVRSGFLVLNQSVLLRGVNDRVDVLARLSRRLLSIGVLPYYLHQLDRVEGAAHFDVPVEVGIEMIRRLRQQLPGYAVPAYVRDDPGGTQKTVLV
jgi:L-lysine 2,3-aminomutase